MKSSIFLVVAVVTLTAHFPTAFSGVVTWTKQGIQYLSNEQFAALQDPYGQGQAQVGQPGQQGLWRDDPNAPQGAPQGAPQAQADDSPPQVYDDDEEEENKSEAEEGDDDVEAEEKEDDDESEEKERNPGVADDEVGEDELPAESEEVKGLKYKVKSKKPKVLSKSAKAQKRPVIKEEVEKSKEQSEESTDDEGEPEAADDEEEKQAPPPQPPMPPVLKNEMMMSQYDAAVNGVSDPNAPLLSRMTSYLTSLLGRGGIGSDPIYMNRNAKSLESPNEDLKVVSRRRRDIPVLSRTKRQIHLRQVELRPFYHQLRRPIRIHQ